MGAFEEGKESCLGAGRAFDAAEPEIGACALEIAEVHEEVLDPETGAFAYCGQLSGLAMGVAETGLVFPLASEVCEFVHYYC